jgi:phenylacetate-CoA ligase
VRRAPVCPYGAMEVEEKSLWIGAQSMAGHTWPPFVRGTSATLENLVRDIEEIQWLSSAEIERRQFIQLPVVAAWCAEHSPLFVRHLNEAGLKPRDLTSRAGLEKLPLLTRRHLQTGSNTDTYCTATPKDHEPVSEIRSSGSTGEPACAKRTRISQLFWLAHTMREYLWQETDFTSAAAIVRASVNEYTELPNWGAPAAALFKTGPAQLLPLRTDVKQQLAWIAQHKPHSLLVYPSVLDAMTREVKRTGQTFENLTIIRTISETLTPHVRAEAEKTFGVKVFDNYSSQECGIIALECPVSRMYHVMADSLIVEVLDDNGRACREGDIGRIVVTDLHNFAMPLIRYVIGDYAEVGGACACGRGLPTLKRIMGRERNLVRLPDGSRHWPHFGIAHFWEHVAVQQFQFVQHDLEHIEVRLVVDKPATPEGEAGLRKLIQDELGHPFDLKFVYFDDALPRPPNGKLEEFICNVKD